MITIENWLRDYILTETTNIAAYTTRIYPNVVSQSTTRNYAKNIPCIVYQDIGSAKNRLNRNRIFSLTSIGHTKTETENLNDQVYDLFDNSTRFIQDSSSNLYVNSVLIISEGTGLYDPDNKYWQRNTDISVWYTK